MARLLSTDGLEPVVPILLALHGLVTPVLKSSQDVELVLVTLVGALGVAGLAGWRGRTAATVRAFSLLAVAFSLPLLDHTLVPHMLQWWYCIVAIYPLILPLRRAILGSTLIGVALFVELPLGSATPSAHTGSWAMRSLLLASLGIIVALAGEAYRTACADAARDRDESERIGRQLQHAATHDHLTGLPNRNTAGTMVDVALRARSREPGDEVAVLLVDLDRFKNVNESLGHLTGDSLLREVADRMQGAVSQGQQLARLGGDEFALICTGLDAETARQTADRLVALFARPVPLAGATYRISLSVGVAVSGCGLELSADLFRAADAAMYAAKGAGRGQAMMFDRHMSEAAEADLAVELRLREVLERVGAHEDDGTDGIRAVFQPVVCLRTSRIISAEALARWELDGHPISPLRFVPLAEELGLGHELTMEISRQALQAMVQWRQAGCEDVRSIAVNVGPRDLLRPGLASRLAQMVEAAGLEPGSLTLEITERDVVVDVQEARAALEDLAAVGITVAIDDFGTGFSSLAYLARLPVHVLKIDRTFVSSIETDDTIARTVVHLARSFGMLCIAEGIETPAQLEALRELGVDAGQGWHLGRPVSAEQFATLAGAQPLRSGAVTKGAVTMDSVTLD